MIQKHDDLNRLLDYMEENIDLEHIAKIEKLQYDAINFKEITHLPLNIRTTPDGFEQIPLEDAYENPELMLYNEILWSSMHSSYNSVRLKDDNPLMIRANCGIGLLASMFGCKVSIFDNAMPWVAHIEMEDAYKKFANGVPDLRSGLGQRVLDFYAYYKDRLAAYPKCSKAIHLSQPDMQGPYDVLHLVIGEEAFYHVYDEPEKTKEMLEIITQTYIDYRELVDPYIDHTFKDASFVHGFTVGGQVLLKCDTASENLSEEMCKEYETDFVKKIIEHFADKGYGSIHCCGNIRPGVLKQFINTKMQCMNYGNPEKHELQPFFEEHMKSKTAVVGWGFNQFYDEMIKEVKDCNIKTGMTLMAKSIDINDGIEILKRHRGF